MPTQRSKRTHSFGGCTTCRKRHLKCDQVLPTCGRCKLSGLACDFSPTLRWLVATGTDVYDRIPQAAERGGAQYSRRHLYTEDARELMSTALIADVPSTVTAALNEIDEESRLVEEHTSSKHAVGPFSVFGTGPLPSVETPASSSVKTAISPSVETIYSESIDTVLTDPPSLADNETGDKHDGHNFEAGGFVNPNHVSLAGPSSFIDMLSNSLDFLQWSDLFAWDTNLLDDSLGLLPLEQTLAQECSLAPTMDWQADVPEPYPETQNHSLVQEDAPYDVAWPEVDLVMDAPLLLKHFNEQVIAQMGSLPINEKSPWRILNVPSAIVTMSHLTVFDMAKDDIKHANLANFYALIAVSSYHLSLNPTSFPSLARQGDHWKKLSEKTYEAAKHHLQLSLEMESRLPNKAKYKDQLMAVAAILATSVLSGKEVDSRRYLTEMERLIRTRGLTKPKISRRARLLHNVYAWMRIVSESTHVINEEAQFSTSTTALPSSSSSNSGAEVEAVRPRRQKRGPVRTINSDINLDNFLQLEQRHLHTETKEVDKEKTETSLRDIHFLKTTQPEDNMYMQIYGVPENWLSLVSQITRLANVMDRLALVGRKADAEILVSLQPKASFLENAVCLFRSRHHLSSKDAEDMGAADAVTPHTHMVRALSSALIIFFYRRIRNANPLVLQDSVNQVITSLHEFDKALEQKNLLGPGTAWPAFIAGAEAMSRTQRHEILTWLRKGSARSGFDGYKTSEEVLLETWKRRDAAGGATNCATWMDVCKSMKRWPLLC